MPIKRSLLPSSSSKSATGVRDSHNDDDNVSVRTTNSAFSSLSLLRGRRRWGGNASAMESNATLLPSYEEAAQQQQVAGPSSSGAAKHRKALSDKEKQHGDSGNDDDNGDDECHSVTIDGQQMDAFVRLEEMEAHLTLLTAYRDMRRACYAANDCSTDAQRESAWNIYLRRATYRMSLYIDNVLSSLVGTVDDEDDVYYRCTSPRTLLGLSRTSGRLHAKRRLLAVPDDALPPLDVAMAWHAYLLNPGRYAEDVARLPSRRHLYSIEFPLLQLARRVRFAPPSSTAAQGPALDVSAACTEQWESATGSLAFPKPHVSTMGSSFALAYVPPVMTATRDKNDAPLRDEGVWVPCLRCTVLDDDKEDDDSGGKHSRRSGCDVSWQKLCDKGPGLCRACFRHMDTNELRAHLFIADIERWLKGEHGQQRWPFSMRGGLVSARNGRLFEQDPHAAVLGRLFACERPLDDAAVSGNKKPRDYVLPYTGIDYVAIKILDDCNQHVIQNAQVAEAVATDLRRRVAMLLRPYLDADTLVPDCSVDLCKAIKRQFTFIEELDKLGWLETRTFDEGQVADARPALTQQQRRPGLANAIVRYHHWLNVLAVRNELLCPTLDIDLAWHTHQLRATYYADCFVATQLFVDHDDTVDAPTLGTAYDLTAKLWYDLYKQPYSVCGCAVAARGNVIGRSLRSIKSSLAKSPSSPSSPSSSSSSSGKATAVAERDQATHPSAHNAVIAADSVEDRVGVNARLKQQERDWNSGARDAGHADVFVKGHGRTPLRPFERVPSTTTYVPGNCMTGGFDAVEMAVGPSRCVGVRPGMMQKGKGKWAKVAAASGDPPFRGPPGSHYDPIGASGKLKLNNGAPYMDVDPSEEFLRMYKEQLDGGSLRNSPPPPPPMASADEYEDSSEAEDNEDE